MKLWTFLKCSFLFVFEDRPVPSRICGFRLTRQVDYSTFTSVLKHLPCFLQIVLLIAFMCITLLLASLLCLTLPGNSLILRSDPRITVEVEIVWLWTVCLSRVFQCSPAAGWCPSGLETLKSMSCTQQRVACMFAGCLSAESLCCWPGCLKAALSSYAKSRSGHSWWVSVSRFHCWRTPKLQHSSVVFI